MQCPWKRSSQYAYKHSQTPRYRRLMEPMQDPLDISTGRIVDALLSGSLINGAVKKVDVNPGGENDKGVVYEQVMEEVVQDDILIYEGGIEGALKTEPINSEDRIAKALNAGVMKADEFIAEGRMAEARSTEAANIKTRIAKEMANETLIADVGYAKDRHAELSNTESILFEERQAEFLKIKAMIFNTRISRECYITAKVAEPMDARILNAEVRNAVVNSSEATDGDVMEDKTITNKGMDDETLTDEDRKFKDLKAEAMVAEALDDKAGNADSTLFQALVDEAFSGATTQDKGTTDGGEANDEPISIDRDQFMNNEDLRQKWLAQHKHFFNSIDSKLNLLKLWAEAKKNIVDNVSKQTNEVQQFNLRLQDLLQQLSEKNLKIDEDDFSEFKKKQLEENPSVEYLGELLKQQYLDALLDQQPPTSERQDEQTTPIEISAPSTSISLQPTKQNLAMSFLANDDGQVVIGPNGTTIAKTALEAINWSLSGPALTRRIVTEVFGHETLAFHSLTGKPSPAFFDCDKPRKGQLDPLKVADVTHFVMEHTDLTLKEVRHAISTKCTHVSNMYHQREKRRKIAAIESWDS